MTNDAAPRDELPDDPSANPREGRAKVCVAACPERAITLAPREPA